jgi:4-hydroxythreonine-4-phosphate dehydrogenase
MILISEGDPAGCGYDMISMLQNEFISISKDFIVILIRGNHNHKPDYFKEIQSSHISRLKPGLYDLEIRCFEKREEIEFGKPSILSGKSSFESLKVAVSLQKKWGGSIITIPLSKEWVIKSGVNHFSGHTEYLAKSYRKDTFMMMTGEEIKLIPLTTHIPLHRVGFNLKKVKWDSLIQAIQSSPLLKNPKIGILGLNPHAGEGGKIGDDEVTWIQEKIDWMRSKGLDVEGPIPADSAFIPKMREKYDLWIAHYHDQGLIPFKLLEGKKGINVTIGLDAVRVSPDHGPAFSLAGKKTCDPESLRQCLRIVGQLNQ